MGGTLLVEYLSLLTVDAVLGLDFVHVLTELRALFALCNLFLLSDTAVPGLDFFCGPCCRIVVVF